MADERKEKGKLWLFDNTYKKNDSHPSLSGSGEMPVSVMREIAEYYNQHKAELQKECDDNPQQKEPCVKLTCAAWPKVSKSDGKDYYFCTFEIKRPREANSAPGNDAPPPGGADIPF